MRLSTKEGAVVHPSYSLEDDAARGCNTFSDGYGVMRSVLSREECAAFLEGMDFFGARELICIDGDHIGEGGIFAASELVSLARGLCEPVSRYVGKSLSLVDAFFFIDREGDDTHIDDILGGYDHIALLNFEPVGDEQARLYVQQTDDYVRDRERFFDLVGRSEGRTALYNDEVKAFCAGLEFFSPHLEAGDLLVIDSGILHGSLEAKTRRRPTAICTYLSE